MTRVALIAGVFLLIIGSATLRAQFVYDNTPLINIIEDIQKKTNYRFLYRETLVSDINLSLNSGNSSLFGDLQSQLSKHNIEMRVDSSRHQAIIYRAEKNPAKRIYTIGGQVVDAKTGERLPFATLTWRKNGQIKGVTANSAGVYHITQPFPVGSITLTASYVGYAPKSVELDLSDNRELKDISFRLIPKMVGGNEIIITDISYYASVDSSLKDYLDIGTFSPLGETNTVRALQMLPSVGLNAALNDGINVRGSSSDGFQILLDELTIFNQSHLFGLLDSFNADALQTSELFYDITPAQYQGSPGGTLSLYTKTGSLNRYHGTAGASNSSYNLTLEGPIKKGHSSFLISARKSYMNSVEWMNNTKLINWGLNVNRPHELLDDNLIDIEQEIVRPEENSAQFFDIHGKFYFETRSGSRFILSGYFGGDVTDQRVQRLVRSFNSNDRLEFQPFESSNDWNNLVASAQFQWPISNSIYSFTTAGASIYRTDFLKEDFTYTRQNAATGSIFLFTYPFQNKSILNEIKAEQRFDISLSDVIWTVGTTYKYYLGEYFERSFNRPGFLTRSASHKIDLFTQFDASSITNVNLFAGGRLHYYSNGRYLKFSPRFKIKLFPESPVSFGAGYSKNYQFLNQVTLSNTVTSDVWILANKDQQPSSVDYLSAGLYLRPWNRVYLQVEGYIKKSENLRQLHEINTLTLANTFQNSPPFLNNSGYGQGVELLLKNSFPMLDITQTFTISSMELENPFFNDGEPFYVEWDRTYRYTATGEFEPVKNLSLYLSWIYASGTPNQLHLFGRDEVERLSNYIRTDLTVEYVQPVGTNRIDMSVSFYNLLDRQNPWYREMTLVLDKSSSVTRFTAIPVNVFDLGFQPSFSLSVSF